ncbi:hypothetical protein QZH47_31185 (plasmid) [Pseudomonas corrugata]
MSRKIANKALMHPFSILRQIGFSPRLMQRLERYRTEQKRSETGRDDLLGVMGRWYLVRIVSSL